MDNRIVLSDTAIVNSIADADPEYLEWLGSKSREQQLLVMNNIKFLMAKSQKTKDRLGARGALELLYKLEKGVERLRNGNGGPKSTGANYW